MSIHGTVPDTEKRISVHSVLYRLRQFVANHLQGKENAMKSGALMNSMGFKAGGTNEKLRSAAKVLLREEGMPLISGNSGFYMAQTKDELYEYLQNLKARRKGIEENENAVRDIMDKWEQKPTGGTFGW